MLNVFVASVVAVVRCTTNTVKKLLWLFYSSLASVTFVDFNFVLIKL